MNEQITLSSIEARKVEIAGSLADFRLIRVPENSGSIIELDPSLQLFFLENKVHDFSTHPRGRANAVFKPAFVYTSESVRQRLDVEFYEREISGASRRMVINGFLDFFDKGNLMLVAPSQQGVDLVILNLTALSDLTLKKLCETLSSESQLQSKNALGEAEEWEPEGENNQNVGFSRDSSPSVPDSELESDSGKRGRVEDSTFLELLEAVWSRGFGGSLAAESPTSQELPSSFRGITSPGLDEISKLFAQDVLSGNNQTSLFLVGGPGAGKSSFARSILSGLGVDMRSKAEASLRGFHVNEHRLIFVNDASIRRDAEDLSLSNDIDESEALSFNLLACVNRGVIADELNHFTDDVSAFAHFTLGWLADAPVELEEVAIESLIETEFLKVIRTQSQNGAWRTTAAVYLDVCSMLEKFPKVWSDGVGWSGLRAESLRDSRRNIGSLKTKPNDTALGSLLLEVSKKLSPDSAVRELGIGDSNPFISNLANLQSEDFLTGLTYSLRVAESSVGSILTFRGFWAILSKLVFGHGVHMNSVSDFLEELTSIEGIINEGMSEVNRDRVMRLRSLNAIYPPFRKASSENSNFGDPGAAHLAVSDPINESDMDKKLGITRSQSADEVGRVVASALKSIDLHSSPLSNLDLGSFELANQKPFTAFDHYLDDYISQLIFSDQLADKARAELLLEYSVYLLRLTGLICGSPAGAREAEVLMSLWRSNPMIPAEDAIQARFTSLIRPKLSGEHDLPSLMPLLESQIKPIVEYQFSAPRLAISLEDVTLSTEIRGPNIFLLLKERDIEIGSVEIDFALVREVLSSTGGSQGVTEMSYFVQPRLERVRASKLRRANNMTSFTLLSGGKEEEVIFRPIGGPND